MCTIALKDISHSLNIREERRLFGLGKKQKQKLSCIVKVLIEKFYYKYDAKYQ